MKRNAFQLLAGLCLLAMVVPAGAAQAAITAQVQPQSLRLGEAAQLMVNIQGAQAVNPEVPDVDGLDIVRVGQQSSMQMINGAVTSDVTLIYQVVPNRVGDFTIPPITAAGAGSTQPIALKVEQGSAGQTQRAPSQRPSQYAQTGFSQTNPGAAPVDSNGDSAFLRVILPKDELTVGELVPVQVKAYFRAGVSASLNGLPMLSSDAFTLNPLSDQPTQTREMVNGEPHTVVTWTSTLSAVKAGDYPLNLELPVMVRVKERAPQRRSARRDPFQDFFGGSSPFSDPFFDDFFGSVTEKPLTLHTDGSVLKIQALPAEGKPADFSGAVGQFEVTSAASATNGTTGEPIQLQVAISGSGNFDRVSTGGLSADAAWKSYKPSADFVAADREGIRGTKIFEQSIVPTVAGTPEIPAVSFSYFNPDTGSYVTKTTEPIPVQIAQGAVSAAPVAAPSTGENTAPEVDAHGLATDKALTGASASSLTPMVLKPWFIVINAAMLAAIVLGTFIRSVRRRMANDPDRQHREATERAVGQALAAMDAALQAKDAPRFFEAARSALQERLAANWQVPASRVTIPEIQTRLDEKADQVSAVFKTADEIAYSGARFTTPDLKQWRDLVKNQLLQLAH